MKRLFIIPIFLLAGFLLIIYLILPSYAKYQTINQEVTDNQTELTRIQDISVGMTQTAQKLLEHQEGLSKVQAAIPAEFSLAPLFSFLQEEAQKSGLILESVSQETYIKDARRPREETKEDRIKEFRVRISVSGFLSSLEGFLNSIENSSRVIEVLSISSSGSEEADTNALGFSLVLKVRAYN